MHRMVMAFITLQQVHDTVGPAQVRAAWPNYFNSYDEEFDRISLMGEETVEERDSRLSRDTWDDWERDASADPHDIFLMNESFGWPGRYLSEPVQIMRWAQARAYDLTRRADAPERENDFAIAMIFAEAKLISKGLIRDAVIVQHENFAA
jgi:hypothetical protein